jgi:hypothetical protein
VDLTSTDLVVSARDWGYTVTIRQIERWREAGIIPGALQHGRGQGQGSFWVHPPEAADRLRIFLEIRRPSELLAETAVRMWQRGCPMPASEVRKHLTKAMKFHRKVRRQAITVGPSRMGEKLADNAWHRPRNRRTLGIEDFDQAAYNRAQELGEAIWSQFSPSPPAISGDTAKLIEGALHLNDQEYAVANALGADLVGEIMTAFPMFANADNYLRLGIRSNVLRL